MVLKDHVRKGKKYIPPLLAMDPPLQEAEWHLERLPELIWIAWLADRLGPTATLEIALGFAKAVESTTKRLRGDGGSIWPLLLSDHLHLSTSEKETILASHKSEPWLQKLNKVLPDLLLLIPELPIAYLCSISSKRRSKTRLVQEFRDVVSRFSHRHQQLALISQATFVSVAISIGRLSLFKEMKVPDFNSIFDFPNTGESQSAAGFVVTTCNMLVRRFPADRQRDHEWPRKFWNACYRLQPCDS